MYGIAFEWDPRKDSTNRRKHGVGFAEATTVFADPLSITIPDPDHAVTKSDSWLSGCPASEICWSWFILLEDSRSARSALAWQRSMRDAIMKKPPSKRNTDEMRAEYDFSGGVRGKYADRYRRGTNVVLLDPALAEAFPDSKSVNDALRALLAVAMRAERRKRA
jgi:uncharacterized DUF497 family protein